MQRTDALDNVNGMFSDGNPEQGKQATVIDAKWLNNVQEEICNLLEDNGVTLDDDNDEQLSQLFSNLFAGHYAQSGYMQTMDIGYFGISIPTSDGYGIFIDSVNKKIELHLEDSGAKHTVIDSSGVTSGAGLFDVLGVNGGIAIGRSGLSFLPTDDQNPASARVTFNGNLTIGGLNNERGLSLFGPMNMTGGMTVGGRVNAKIINNKFIKEYQTTLCQPWTINDFDGVPVDHGDVLFIRNSGDQTLYVEIYQGATVTIPPASGGAFMFRLKRTASGSVISKILVPLFSADVSFS